MICPIEHIDTLALLGEALDPDTGGDDTFSITLTTDSNAPDTENDPHLASIFPATLRIHQMIVAMNLLSLGMIAPTVAGVETYLMPFSDDPTGDAITVLTFVNNANTQAMMSELLWWRTSRVTDRMYDENELQAKRQGLTFGTVGETVTPQDCWQSLGLTRHTPIT